MFQVQKSIVATDKAEVQKIKEWFDAQEDLTDQVGSRVMIPDHASYHSVPKAWYWIDLVPLYTWQTWEIKAELDSCKPAQSSQK